MTPFYYVDFYDVPRTIVFCFDREWFLFESAFNENTDEDETTYSVFSLPGSFSPPQMDDAWGFLGELKRTLVLRGYS
jgi:hypothetical protein